MLYDQHIRCRLRKPIDLITVLAETCDSHRPKLRGPLEKKGRAERLSVHR